MLMSIWVKSWNEVFLILFWRFGLRHNVFFSFCSFSLFVLLLLPFFFFSSSSSSSSSAFSSFLSIIFFPFSSFLFFFLSFFSPSLFSLLFFITRRFGWQGASLAGVVTELNESFPWLIFLSEDKICGSQQKNFGPDWHEHLPNSRMVHGVKTLQVAPHVPGNSDIESEADQVREIITDLPWQTKTPLRTKRLKIYLQGKGST